MDQETFKEIYKNEELRNAVAFAHGCFDSEYKFKYQKALMYPISYKVTKDQMIRAKDLRLKKQKEVLKENYNNLLFCGMGMNFKPIIKDGVGNHRIRTHFLNKDGIECFIEFGKGTDNFLRIDHAIFNYEYSNKSLREQELFLKNNYKNLERQTPKLKYTFENLLKIVNKYFDCNFNKIVLDYYNIRCDGVLCESPKN